MLKFSLSIFTLVFVIVRLSAQTENEPNQTDSFWSTETSVKWMSNYQPYGVEINDGTAFSGSLGFSHSDGFYTDFDCIYLSGISEIENWTAAVGYDYEFNSVLSATAEYSYTQYSSTATTVFSSLNHGLSFSFDAELPWDISASLFFDHYFGNLPASYYGLSVSSYFKLGGFSFIPILQATMVSQTVETSLLKSPKSGKQLSAGTTKNISGFSNFGVLSVIIYPITDQIKLTATPSFLITPNSNLTTGSSQFNLSVGIKYGFDF